MEDGPFPLRIDFEPGLLRRKVPALWVAIGFCLIEIVNTVMWMVLPGWACIPAFNLTTWVHTYCTDWGGYWIIQWAIGATIAAYGLYYIKSLHRWLPVK